MAWLRGTLRRIARLLTAVAWTISVVAITLTGIALLQRFIVAFYPGQSAFDPASVWFLWMEFSTPFGLEPTWFLIGLFTTLLFVLKATVGAVKIRVNRPLTLLRTALGTSAVLLAIAAIWGMVQGGSGIVSLLEGEFSLGLGFQIDSAGVTTPNSAIYWTALVASAVAGVLYFSVSYLVHVYHAGRSLPHKLESHADSIDRASRELRIDRRQLTFFEECILSPTLHFERAKESLEIYAKSVSVNTRLVVNFGRRQRVYLPFMLVARGEVVDGLTVTIGDQRVSPMPHLEASAVALRVVRERVRQAGRRAFRSYMLDIVEWPDGSHKTLDSAILEYLSGNRSRVSVRDDSESASNQARAFLGESLVRLNTSSDVGASALVSAAQMVFRLVDVFPIAVEVQSNQMANTSRGAIAVLTSTRRLVPTSSHVSLREIGSLLIPSKSRTENTTSLDQVRAWFRTAARALPELLNWFSSLARHWVGIAPAIVRHHLEVASAARSYHLELKGPENTYLARQRFRSTRIRTLPLDDFGIESFSSPAHGQRHVHLYIRHGSEVLSRISFEATFFERTPGSMAVAAISAGSALFISAILAVNNVGAFGTPDVAAQGSELLQLLLAFPLATAAAGVLTPRQGVLGAIAVARVANSMTIALSLAALWVSSVSDSVVPEALPRVWLAIILGLVFIFAACSWSWFTRVSVHSRFIHREEA